MAGTQLTHEEVVRILLEALRTVAPDLPAADEHTLLVGEASVLDSVGFVSMLVTVEEMLSRHPTQLSGDFTLLFSGQEAFTENQPPFRTVGTLADYIVRLSGPGFASR